MGIGDYKDFLFYEFQGISAISRVFKDIRVFKNFRDFQGLMSFSSTNLFTMA